MTVNQVIINLMTIHRELAYMIETEKTWDETFAVAIRALEYYKQHKEPQDEQ